jgi:hypothetical protein
MLLKQNKLITAIDIIVYTHTGSKHALHGQ